VRGGKSVSWADSTAEEHAAWDNLLKNPRFEHTVKLPLRPPYVEK
ncbi:unnamed protein product, partial [Didymodactylos carnosus]